ncbi:putative coiled-coil domain-containing protein 158 isoform 2 [Scophthalmus maximus]|uniref:Putative coiled-coil domain-containing protein 158 isoform 2 n=1 Tax=Scophthalmus maximus TaxID=52904 RepID=A0A2U9BTI9_SCOMX|nr:putative coiled-coil domain-containing protein 158 isoform 2 [Scophthalmus maximus]
MEKMLRMLEELQNIKRAADQKLHETEDEASALNRKVETLEQIMKETYSSLLSHEKQRGNSTITSPNIITCSRPPSPAAKLTEDHNNETDKLQERLVVHLSCPLFYFIPFNSENEQTKKLYYAALLRTLSISLSVRTEELIASLCQEMALLTDKLSSSKHNSVSLSDNLELLKKLTGRQTSLHQCQIGELESTLTSHKDKVCCLERQLLHVRSQLADAQREREQSLQQTAELQSQLGQLKVWLILFVRLYEHVKKSHSERGGVLMTVNKSTAFGDELSSFPASCMLQNVPVGVNLSDTDRCSEQQQCELQLEVKALGGWLEEAREQLHRVGKEKNCLQALLDRRTQEGRTAQELLREKDEELRLRQQEGQQHLSQCQTLQVEGETLRLKLEDREKLVDILRLQMESSVQMSAQHSCTIDSLHQENSLLRNQLNQHKLEIQHLRAELERHKSDLSTAAHERRQLLASVAEQSRRVQEESLEKKRLSTQLEFQRMQILTLTKEHEEQQRLRSCKNDEHEGVVLRLRSQLRDTRDELDQVRGTLRTLEGADGHGLQVAMDMQKEITSRREQVDSLQGRIQHLEETVEKLYQEKRHQSLESQRQLHDLTFVKEEKKQLATELGALRSKDQQLRDRIEDLEAILHKMSASFAECQDFIQLQEQDFYRLKLQHALDLKDFQGQNLHTALNVPPPDLDSPNPSALRAPPSAQHAANTQIKASPARELRSLVKELRGVISENHRPHTYNSPADSSFHRRRSAPERVHRTTCSDKTEEVKAASRLRRRTCHSEPHFLTKAELNGKKMINKDSSEKVMARPGRGVWSPATAVRCTSTLQLLSLGRRSPVHSLLTSDPNS